MNGRDGGEPRTNDGPARKILYLAGLDPTLHQGHATHVRRLCEALAARGHGIRLLCLAPSARSASFGWGPPAVDLGTVKGVAVPRLQHLSSESRFAGLLRRNLRESPPDLILVRQELFTIAPLLAGLGRNRSIERPRDRSPLLVETNASLPGVARIGAASPVRIRLARFLEGKLLRAADAVGAVSAELARFQIRSHALDPDRVRVIPNGTWVPPAPMIAEVRALRAARGVAEDEFVLAFIGSLDRGQGLPLLFDGIPGLTRKRVRLWIVGEGPLAGGFERESAARGLPVSFLGGMEETEAALHAAAAQLLIIPYSPDLVDASKGDSLKLLFGLACNRPLLCSRFAGSERVEQLEAGEVVADAEPGAWTAAISRWIERWASAGRPLADWPWPASGGPGLLYVQRDRTWDHTAAAWEALFDLTASARTARG